MSTGPIEEGTDDPVDTHEPEDTGERDPGADIAVVGMAANLPGAPDVGTFWAEMCAGRDGITRMSRAELLAAGVDPALADDPAFVPAAGLLPDVDQFDAGFFGYGRADAELIDPQHRLFLECAWHALEDGGVDPARVEGLVGVYAGGAPSTYLLSSLLQSESTVATHGPDQLFLQNEKDLIASRLSYALDLRGPSVSVQSCSSTALSAVAQACSGLLLGECDLAVAGAVSVVSPQEPGYLYREGSRFAPDGVNKVLDAGADGKVPGSGLGAVVLRRLEDAEADGDRVYAVIRGWAINHEGNAGRHSFNFPGVPGQAAVITEALAAAGLEPGDIDHVEVNAIGTPFGDVAEISALQQVFDVDGVERVTLGALDGNIGHINQAGGIARLIKAALALHHEELPPAVHFDAPNPQLDAAGGKLVVQRERASWPRGERPRRAGMTAYGFGGTNAHVVMEEAPEAAGTDTEAAGTDADDAGPDAAPAARPHEVLVWSARSAESVEVATTRLQEAAEGWEPAGVDLADVAYTLQYGRTAFAHRRMTVASSPADAAAALGDGTLVLAGTVTGPRPAGFLLPGVGEQYAGMAGGLYANEPVFAAAVDECRERFTALLGVDPVASLVGPRAAPANDLARLMGRGPEPADDGGDGPDDAETTLVQPGVFTVGYALGRLFAAWGVTPAVLAGYSVGEFAAATLAGALTLDEATGLVAHRARLISALPRGAMAAVPLSAADLTAAVGDLGALDVAAVNGPRAVVVSGPADAVEALTATLAEQSVPARGLRTTHAFHSRHLRPAAAELTAWARENIAPRTPATPYLSNVTGEPVTDAQLADPGYWAEHMCRPVQFASMVGHLAGTWPGTALVELGAGQSLGAMIRGIPEFPQESWTDLVPVLPAESDPGTDTAALAGALGRLWLSGVPIDWRAHHDGRAPRKTTLPGYAFDHERYWIEPTDPLAGSGSAAVFGQRAAQPEST